MKFQIITLGCKVNTYESNVISDMFKNDGYTETNNNDADIYIINTCTVTNTADNKTIKLINKIKENNLQAIIVVAGCLVQIKPDLINQIPGMNIVVGNQNKSKILSYVKRYNEDKNPIIDISDISKTDFENMELINSNKTRSFVKIQDGCNNFCTYCIIPFARGNPRSKDQISVIKEVSKLVENGHQEVVLTGIHTGSYGIDFKDYDFANLLSDLLKIDGLKRIRISSIEITEINDRIIDLIKNNNILVDHMHIPLQSGSNKILKLMNRKYDKQYFIEKIEKLRSIRPDISITTDVIVGFPYETEELFEETIETIRKIGFTKLHVFPYSKRNGTKAAAFDEQVSEEDKKKRVKTLMQLSKELEKTYNEKFIGRTMSIIVESFKDGYITGHTGNYLLIKAEGNREDYHQMVEVKITGIKDFYCLGEKIKN